jgi:acetyl-CoA synthetase
MTTDASPFVASRDFIVKHRTDYDAAARGFRWPAQTHFNWALDYC